MAINVNITSVVGTPPYLAWVCDSDAVNNVCVFISSFSTIPFTFTLPEEFETAGSYCIKVIDAESCENYECFGNLSSPSPTATPTQTVTPTPSVTPSVTPSITPTQTVTTTPSVTLSVTPSITPTQTITPTPTPSPSQDAILCDDDVSVSETGSARLYKFTAQIGSGTGNYGFVANAYFGYPDRFVAYYDGVKVIDEGFIGGNISNTPATGTYTYDVYDDYTYNNGNITFEPSTSTQSVTITSSDIVNVGGGAQILQFNKTTATPTTMDIWVYSHPTINSTQWSVDLFCGGPSPTPTVTPTVTPSVTPSITVSPSVTPTPSTSGTLEDNTFQFLSAASENVLILRRNIHTINANIGDYVSGTTYPAVEKTGRAFHESITWSQTSTPMPSYNLAYNKDGQLVEFPNTVYKLISFDEFKSTPNGQSNQYMCLLPKFDNSGNTVNYNFTTVPEQDLEITPFSGTVKIRYDIAKASVDLGYSYEDVEERFTLIAGQVEDFFSDSDLDFTVDFDVFLHTGTTFYDNMSLASYYEYHRDRGGIFENTGYHLGGIMSPAVVNAGGAYLGSKYFSIGGSGSFNMRTWPYTHETIIHEIGHCFGLQHAFTRTFRYMPGQEDGYWAQSNSSTLEDIHPLSGYPRGDYMSSKSSDKFNANERFSVMAYAGNSYIGDGSARNAASALRVYPRSGTTYNRDGDNGIQFDARFKTDNGTSPSRRQGNVNYIDFIDDNTFSQGELTAVTCNFESRIERHYIYSAPGTINVSLSGYAISDTGYTVNMFEIDGSGLTENYSAYSFTITGQNLNNVFDYNNQSDFGVKFQVKTEDDNTHRISLNYDMTLDFYSSGGTNDLLSLKPRELFTVSYTDDTLSQIEDKYLSSGYISTHYTRDTFTPYEVRIVKSYANRLKNYFSE